MHRTQTTQPLMMRTIYFKCLYPYDKSVRKVFRDKLLSHFDLSIFFKNCGRNIMDTKIPKRFWSIFFCFVQCSKHTDSSPHCFELVYIRIPTGDTRFFLSI